MQHPPTYLIPAHTIRVEQEIKKSRFVAAVGRAENKTEALSFIENERETYPDARHHCWAYVAGNPKDTIDIGMSDDGEPQGTAGKPILHVLQQSGIGEIVAVVTRYFGGIKLGTGGLFRAYSGSVQLAMKELVVREYVALKKARITLSYTHEKNIGRLLKRHKGVIKEKIYEDKVIYQVEVPEKNSGEFSQQILNHTHGEVSVEWHQDFL